MSGYIAAIFQAHLTMSVTHPAVRVGYFIVDISGGTTLDIFKDSDISLSVARCPDKSA